MKNLNPLRFHWMLPKGGEMSNQETAIVLTTSTQSFAGRPDTENWVYFAEKAEEMGIESVLLSFGNYEPDTLQTACALGLKTKKLNYIVAYRLGLMQPSLFVQQVNTLSNYIDGRLSINVIAGSSPPEQRGYGDFLPHDQRYARAEEFLEICHRFWKGDASVTFTGDFCKLEGGKLHTPYHSETRSHPELYVSGHSQGAQDLAIHQGSCWIRLIDTPEKIAPMIQPVLKANKEVCLRTSIICRKTKTEALEAAETLKRDRNRDPNIAKTVRSFIQNSDSVYMKEALATAVQGDWANEYLWTGLVPTNGPAVVSLVGTPDEITAALMEYKKIGVSQFIISGWPKLEEMLIFGQEVIPRVRKAELANSQQKSYSI